MKKKRAAKKTAKKKKAAKKAASKKRSAKKAPAKKRSAKKRSAKKPASKKRSSKKSSGSSKGMLADSGPSLEEFKSKKGTSATAESMAKKQREISVSEFFTKNRHLLGFDNPKKALLTTIKEAVDNALDACEEAHILPDLSVKVDPERLEQEVVMLVQRADVMEEVDRLDIHIEETRDALSKEGPPGRRLYFLMQEFNREANTLGSKSVLTQTTQKSIDLKVIIEQIREQVQNIE